jgi:hypothetical protein
MPRGTTEIKVRQRRDASGVALDIRVRGGDGQWHSYRRLEDVPSQWRALVARLLDGAPDLALTDVPAPPPRRQGHGRQGHRRQRPRRRSRSGDDLIFWWFDPLAAFGALVLSALPLYAARRALLGQAPWSIWTFVALLIAGAGVYFMLVFLLNRSRLRVTAAGLDVRHGPLPWPGGRFYPREDLLQLFVRIRSGRYTDYSLCALTPAGEVKLLGNFARPQELRELECELERRLGVEDEPVPGSQYR